MNTVNVAYEIFDFVEEGKVKKKRESRKSATAQRPGARAAKYASPVKPEKASIPHQSAFAASSSAAGFPSSASPRPHSRSPSREQIPPHSPNRHLPPRRPQSGLSRRGPHHPLPDDKHPWNSNCSRPDRDDLIISQDLEVSRCRAKHHEPLHTNSPQLQEVHSRKERKACSSRENRDRPLHHSFGAVANDPLPFHPLLHEVGDMGIHNKRWMPAGEFAEEDIHEWDKPKEHQDRRGRSQFQQAFRIQTANPRTRMSLPESEVDALHSMASVVSSYSAARTTQRGLKTSRGEAAMQEGD
jgi:hypothetical protein